MTHNIFISRFILASLPLGGIVCATGGCRPFSMSKTASIKQSLNSCVKTGSRPMRSGLFAIIE